MDVTEQLGRGCLYSHLRGRSSMYYVLHIARGRNMAKTAMMMMNLHV